MVKKKHILTADEFRKKYKYKVEPDLTKELDSIGNRPMTPIDIYKITLWKVGRFPHIDENLLKKLNQLSSMEGLNENKTHAILDELLNCKGVRLPMASTYLRFRNPKVFQIIDRHMWFQVYHKDYKELSSNEERIRLYFMYLKDLRELCKKDNVDFTEADRFYFEKDKAEGHIIGEKCDD